jgi:opacity protein-like surface antigen
MRGWIKGAAMLLALAGATPAWAAGEHYFGAGIGAFNLNNAVNRDTVFGGYVVGGHHFNEYFSAEIRLGGTASSGGGAQPKQRMDFVAHYLKPQIAIASDFIVYGLVGFAVVHGSYQAPGGVKQSKNRISYAYGAGFNYQVSDDFSVDAEVTHMLSKPGNRAATIATSYGGLEADSFTAAVKYHF